MARPLCDDTHFWPLDFRCVDTRPFMRQNGPLAVSVNYAYAAADNRILVNEDGHLVMVYSGDTFHVPEDQWDHFSIRFSDHVVEQIEDAYVRAGLPNFVDTLEAMGIWSRAQIAEAHELALTRMPSTTPADRLANESVTQGAVYDPESGDWLFVNFD